MNTPNAAITNVQLITGAVLHTKPMDFQDALYQRTRVEEAMTELQPSMNFPHRHGQRVIASRHIVQTWTQPVTVTEQEGGQ